MRNSLEERTLQLRPFTGNRIVQLRHVKPSNCGIQDRLIAGFCEMDPDLFELLASPDFRLKARMVLISKYFDRDEQAALFEMLGLHGTATREGKAAQLLKEATEAAKRKGRCARFEVKVVTKYQFTCALTGYRCITADGAAIVDGAQIEQTCRNLEAQKAPALRSYQGGKARGSPSAARAPSAWNQ